MVLKKFKDRIINFLNLNYIDLHSIVSGTAGAKAFFGTGDWLWFEGRDAEDFRKLRWQIHIAYPVRVGGYVINLDRICRVQVSDAADGGDSVIFFDSGDPLSLSPKDTERFAQATVDLTIDL